MAFPDVPVLYAETRLAKAVRAADAPSGATPSGLPTGPELPESIDYGFIAYEFIDYGFMDPG